MKICYSVILIILIATTLQGQQGMEPTPYESIESKPDQYTAATILARMIDGLGYRYHWATRSLTDEDLIFRPSEDASSVIETMHHIHSLSLLILNTLQGKPHTRANHEDLAYIELRHTTLMNLSKASNILTSHPDMDLNTLQIIFQRGDRTSSFDLWHLINGPIADAIYHTGQIVSFRRTNENPLHPKVSVFMGKNRE